VKITTLFDIGNRVTIDGDASLVGTVSGFLWRKPRGMLVEIAWIHSGSSHEVWIDEWRLELVNP
jgi:hypothetical protein